MHCRDNNIFFIYLFVVYWVIFLLDSSLLQSNLTKIDVVQDQSHCTVTKFATIENRNKPLVLKELRKLWDKLEPNLPWEKGVYNDSNTLLLDDSPYKALRNPVSQISGLIFSADFVHIWTVWLTSVYPCRTYPHPAIHWNISLLIRV